MTRKYDPGQVTHPLDVAQSAALVGGAAGTYKTEVVRRIWQSIRLFGSLTSSKRCLQTSLVTEAHCFVDLQDHF